MDLRQIKYFLTVADEMNITRAAEKLNLSQPPLSRALMDLEEELGCQLMIRGKRQITLTPEGIALRRRVEQMLSLVDMTRNEISDMGKGITGTLYLGHVDANGPSLVAEWIQSFQKQYPNVTYNLWCGTVDDLTDRLESGILDLAITMTPLNNELLDGIPVFTENWVAMIPKTHPLAKGRRKTVDIQELAGNDLIISSRRSRHEEITGWFENQGKKPRIKIQIAHSSNAVHLVERGIGIAIFPASVAKNISSESNVVIKKITPEVSVTYLLSWDRKRTPGVLASRFIEHVKALQ
jgi:DNA-binding transcriptional LysR family regulator